MADDERLSDDVVAGVKKIAEAAVRRGHATFYHIDNEHQDAMEVSAVRDWAEIMSRQKGWAIRSVEKNKDEYPDCIVEVALRGSEVLQKIGIEVTELVNKEAIRAHQEMRRIRKCEKAIDRQVKLDIMDRMESILSAEDFEKLLFDCMGKKASKARDGSLYKQILLIITDEFVGSDVEKLDQLVKDISIECPKNFDAVHLMTSYIPTTLPGHAGTFKVYELVE